MKIYAIAVQEIGELVESFIIIRFVNKNTSLRCEKSQTFLFSDFEFIDLISDNDEDLPQLF